MPPRAGGSVPSSQARLSGGCQSGAGPRGALRAATGAAAWNREGAGRGGATPRPSSPAQPSRGHPSEESQPRPRTTASPPRPHSLHPPGAGAHAGWSPGASFQGVGARAWRGVCATWKVFYCVLTTPPLRRAAGEEGDRAVHQWLLESEKSLPVSFLALGGAARARRSRIVLIRASLCRRL